MSTKVDNLKKIVGERIKLARSTLGLTQRGLCEATEMPLPSLRNYELSKQVPGGEAINSFIRAGINANWLLTGEGPLLISDLQIQPVSDDLLDQDRLCIAVQAVEEGLLATSRSMEPDKKAELILAVYDLLEEPSASKEKVLKLVKLAT